jgi:prepilin-type N-terminal cleavage/methylation domain-containing protein
VNAFLRILTRRARAQAGFGMIELLCAMTVLSIGILAVFGMFQSSAVQIRRASTVTTAAALADAEIERFRAVKYETIGLASTDISAADSTYTGQSGGAYKAISSPENLVNSTVVVAKCPPSPCTSSVPTKTVSGADGKSYRVDTYITWSAVSNANGVAGRNVKLVTLLVRDPSTLRVHARVASSFDAATGQ